MTMPAAIRTIRQRYDRLASLANLSRGKGSEMHNALDELRQALEAAEREVVAAWQTAYRYPDDALRIGHGEEINGTRPVAFRYVYLGEEVAIPMPPPGAMPIPEWAESRSVGTEAVQARPRASRKKPAAPEPELVQVAGRATREPPMPSAANLPEGERVSLGRLCHWIGRSGRVILGNAYRDLGTSYVVRDTYGVETVLAPHELRLGWPEGAR